MRLKLCSSFILVVISFFSFLSLVSAKTQKQKNTNSDIELSKKITQIFSAISDSKNNLGVVIADGIDEDDFQFTLNSHNKLIPASVSKVLTSAAVLKAIPPGTKLKTQLYYDGKNLYLKGGGDPGFVSETMWFLVNHFTRNEIKKVTGEIIVDDSLFDKERFDSSRQKVRVDRAYDAPTGAMSFNWNSINVFIRPGDSVGTKAKVFLDPESDYAQLKSEVKTVDGSTQDLFVDREETKNGDLIIVRGKIGIKAKEAVVFKNITKPDLWAGQQLKAFLKQRGVTVEGNVSNGKVPDSARLVAEAESKPIELLLADMNKFSNNYVAEMLTKNIAALKKSPGTIVDGVAQINEYLKSNRAVESEYHIVNPSGLTRENKLSAWVLFTTLWDLHSHLKTSPEFLNSLPIAGIDGTLKKRMKGSQAEGWVRAKTGYLDDVVSLAGYAGTPKGKVYTFSMIYNGKTDEAKVRATFDRVLEELVRQ